MQEEEFKADSVLNKLHTRSKCDFLMSSDLDYLVQNGDNCIGIKIFNGGSIIITSTSRVTLKNAIMGIGEDGDKDIKVKEASGVSLFSPIFEGIADRQLCVLLAVIIDSDAWPN